MGPFSDVHVWRKITPVDDDPDSAEEDANYRYDQQQTIDNLGESVPVLADGIRPSLTGQSCRLHAAVRHQAVKPFPDPSKFINMLTVFTTFDRRTGWRIGSLKLYTRRADPFSNQREQRTRARGAN